MLGNDVGALSGKPRIKRGKCTRSIAVDVEQARGCVQRPRIDMWKIDRPHGVTRRQKRNEFGRDFGPNVFLSFLRATADMRRQDDIRQWLKQAFEDVAD